MKVFDQINPEDLDRREFHLWILTTTALVVLVMALAFLMYPAVFPHSITLGGSTLRISFFGFCVLATLLIGYLIDRQATIVQLRKAIAQERERLTELRSRASQDFLNSLSGLNQFQDRLAMEFRRAANTSAPLSILVIQITTANNISKNSATLSVEELGDGIKAVARKLRPTDSLFHFCTTHFGVILPQLNLEEARQFVARIEEGLKDAAGIGGRFSALISVFNYPLESSTARELLEGVRSRLPEGLTGEPSLDADLLLAELHR
ncbi:MAG TPA: GGDEF domain-containing protein [Candidatus Acidoferrales bacterium]|nr:GGDEF domain-containing protein [Candidatus Acidoferrales bacterium]